MRECYNKNRPIVSVIIPVYNVESYLIQCLDSVNSQIFADYEVILIDDGSTDKSGALCDSYRFSHADKIVIHQENRGLSEARNAGIEASNGKFLFFLDSDDVLHPEAIDTLVRISCQNDADIVECGVARFSDEEGDPFGQSDSSMDDIVAFEGEAALEMILNRPGLHIATWNKLYRRELFEGVRFPPGKLHEDEFTTPYLVERSSMYVRISKDLYGYRSRGGSITQVYSSKRVLDICEAFGTRLSYFSDRYGEKYESFIAYDYYCHCSDILLMWGEYLDDKLSVFVLDEMRAMGALLLKSNTMFPFLRKVDIALTCKYQNISSIYRRMKWAVWKSCSRLIA